MNTKVSVNPNDICFILQINEHCVDVFSIERNEKSQGIRHSKITTSFDQVIEGMGYSGIVVKTFNGQKIFLNPKQVRDIIPIIAGNSDCGNGLILESCGQFFNGKALPLIALPFKNKERVAMAVFASNPDHGFLLPVLAADVEKMFMQLAPARPLGSAQLASFPRNDSGVPIHPVYGVIHAPQMT